jgi:hypothetical protein
MSRVTLLLFLLAAYADVFLECWFDGWRHLMGVQISLLPPLMVYAGLTSNLFTTCLIALCGGFWYDSLSINPFGISVLPLLAVGWGVYFSRDYLLRDQPVAQIAAGAAGSLVAPLLTFLFLCTLMPLQHPDVLSTSNWERMATIEGGAAGEAVALRPSVDWMMGMKMVVVAAFGALATPMIFRLFDFVNRHFDYASAPAVSFRPDRQIVRGRR